MTAVAAARDQLALRLDAVVARLERAAGTASVRAARGPDRAAELPGDGLALVAARCSLSAFEQDLLVLVAGAELDPAVPALCVTLHGDPGARLPTFGLAMRVLPAPHWDAVAADGPLRRLALVELDRGRGTLLHAPLTVPERVLLLLLGHDAPCPDLTAHAEPVAPQQPRLTDRQGSVLDAVAAALGTFPAPVVELWGRAADRRAAESALPARAGAPRAWRVRPGDVDRDELTQVARRLARESVLTSAPVIVDADDDGPVTPVVRRLAAAGCRVVVSAAAPVGGLPAEVVRHELPTATYAEARVMWRAALGDRAAGLNGELDRIAGHFRPGAQALAHLATTSGGSLWEAARTAARTDLGALAEHRRPRASWDDLVLPERETALLRDVLRHARQRARVLEDWLAGGVGPRGAGVTALFSGPSGTGKTLAAEVVATELGVDLLTVDLSQVVSKWVGETEKALRRVFDAAEQSGAVLVIDEADALFGKRTEVRDSHDRYANIEVSYLLQRMEAYRGLAVLTTNLRASIDEAFLRRLSFVVDFPFPDHAARARIWSRVLGPRVPVESLDVEVAAALTLSGGGIRNVAVNAAFRAADEGRAVTMSDVLYGAHAEYAKIGRPPTPTEVAGWPS